MTGIPLALCSAYTKAVEAFEQAAKSPEGASLFTCQALEHAEADLKQAARAACAGGYTLAEAAQIPDRRLRAALVELRDMGRR